MAKKTETKTTTTPIEKILSFVPTDADIIRIQSYPDANSIPSVDWLKIIHRHIGLCLDHKNLPGGVGRITRDDDKGPIVRVLMFAHYAPTCAETIPNFLNPDLPAKTIAGGYLASKDQNTQYLEGFEMIANDIMEGNKFLIAINMKNNGKELHEEYDSYVILVLDPEIDRFVDLKEVYGSNYL